MENTDNKIKHFFRSLSKLADQSLSFEADLDNYSKRISEISAAHSLTKGRHLAAAGAITGVALVGCGFWLGRTFDFYESKKSWQNRVVRQESENRIR